MRKRLTVVMDPIHNIHAYKDSTLSMLRAAQREGWRLQYAETKDLAMRAGVAQAYLRPLTVFDDNNHWFELGEASWQSFADSTDAVLMRKDPPFNMEYIYASYILQRAEEANVVVVNSPQSLRDANEKAFLAWFPEISPDTLISKSMSALRAFVDEHEFAVIKPLDGMGGRSIFLATHNDPNLGVIIETITAYGSITVVAQAYLPQIKTDGDKRILLIDGEPIPYALARVPGAHDHRGNLAVGATSKGVALSERDYFICDQLKQPFRDRGIVFAGIDVIGNFMTEINVTSPTGIVELDKMYNLDISTQLMRSIEKKCV